MFYFFYPLRYNTQNIMKYSKKQLLTVSKKITTNNKITPNEMEFILAFEKRDEESKTVGFLKKSAVPLGLTLGFMMAVFPQFADHFSKSLPSWTNLPDPIFNGLNYIWNIIGDTVDQKNILYHIPNIILYSFGFLGIKKLFDAIDRRTWVDKVNFAKGVLTKSLSDGTLNLDLSKGHSVLFSGNGDFIATQFVHNHKKSDAVTIASVKPSYTNIWNYYDANSSYDALEKVINRVCDKTTGEYIFFPVKDDQIFLPGETSYDLSPHKLDILCQDLRTIEKQNKWKPKRILIVGDRFHKSVVQSEDRRGKIQKSEDVISLETISKKYPNVTIIDPTDIVLKKVIEIANGRVIAFRATKEGIQEYKKRFYDRLDILKYKPKKITKGILTIGYDLLEDQTEQQTLARKIDDYYPVVLSKSVADALLRNGYKKTDFIYVPDLVIEYLSLEASRQ